MTEKKKTVAQEIFDFTMTLYDSTSAGMSKSKIDDVAALGRYTSKYNAVFGGLYTVATSENKISGVYEATCKAAIGGATGFITLGAGPWTAAISVGIVSNAVDDTCKNFGNYAYNAFHTQSNSIDSGRDYWRGKAQQEKAWDQDYNKNGEYEAEQNKENGSDHNRRLAKLVLAHNKLKLMIGRYCPIINFNFLQIKIEISKLAYLVSKQSVFEAHAAVSNVHSIRKEC